MAIIKCPECGGKLSDQARRCPHCGYENKPASSVNNNSQRVAPSQYYIERESHSNNNLLWVLIAVAVLLLGGGAACVWYFGEKMGGDKNVAADFVGADSCSTDTVDAAAVAKADSVKKAEEKAKAEKEKKEDEKKARKERQRERAEEYDDYEDGSAYVPYDAFTCRIDGPANVRKQPNTSSAVMGSIRNGMTATVSHVSGSMYQIHSVHSTDGRRAYTGKVIGYYTHRQNLVIDDDEYYY